MLTSIGPLREMPPVKRGGVKVDWDNGIFGGSVVTVEANGPGSVMAWYPSGTGIATLAVETESVLDGLAAGQPCKVTVADGAVTAVAGMPLYDMVAGREFGAAIAAID